MILRWCACYNSRYEWWVCGTKHKWTNCNKYSLFKIGKERPRETTIVVTKIAILEQVAVVVTKKLGDGAKGIDQIIAGGRIKTVDVDKWVVRERWRLSSLVNNQP